MLKIDGHTHTELCPHGSHESTRAMVERAIELGFDEYWITEHAPMPKDFVQRFAGPADDWQTEGLSREQVDDYLNLAEQLQSEYADQIKISIGFEIEYLAGFEETTRAFLDQYGKNTQHNILSVHYLQDDQGKFWGIDYSTDELQAGFANELKTPQLLYQRYLKTVLASARCDLGSFSPDKLGHISLIKKYQDYFSLPEAFDQSCQRLIDEIMATARKRQLSLDFNSAGLYKKYCNDFYPGSQIALAALNAEVPLIFGSDAHSVDEVGRGWHGMKNFLKVLDTLKR